MLSRKALYKLGRVASLVFVLFIMALWNPTIHTDLTAGLAAQEASPPKSLSNMFIINEDNSHFFFTRKVEEMNISSLHAFIDQYAGTKVTHLFICPNAQRANFDTKVWTPIWAPVPGNKELPQWAFNVKVLFDKGIDPYHVWFTRCREKGISPWISMRMNDLHDVNDRDNYQHSDFWRNHPEYWRIPNVSDQDMKPWHDRALNFAYPQVRQYNLDFIQELLERYDVDGIELDWMRFSHHLTPEKAAKEGPLLTDFVEKARNLVKAQSKKRGHSIYLGVRVPTNPDVASDRGLNAVDWARKGLVDLIIASPFFHCADFDIPIEHWQERLVDAKQVAFAAALENGILVPGSYRIGIDTMLPMLYGFVDVMRYRGTNNIYLFNWFDAPADTPRGKIYRTVLTQGIDPGLIERSEKSYPLTYRDTDTQKFRSNWQLPRMMDKPVSFTIPMGKKLKNGRIFLLVGIDQKINAENSGFTVQLNRNDASGVTTFDTTKRRVSSSTVTALRYEFPIQSVCSGVNTIDLTPTKKSSSKITWLELQWLP